jgi:hypothetical protein
MAYPLPFRARGGNARQSYERYLALGREAQLAEDEVEMERCYQFAEHYFRVMRAANARHWAGDETARTAAVRSFSDFDSCSVPFDGRVASPSGDGFTARSCSLAV